MRDADVPRSIYEARTRTSVSVCLFVCFVYLDERTGPDGAYECEIFKRFFNLISSHLALNPSNRDDDAGTTTMDDVRLSDGFDDG